ncbi:MAG: nitrilase-related carbon-nitrogen hydrolase [Rubrivivax sp.]
MPAACCKGATCRATCPAANSRSPDDEWINGGDSVVVAPGGKVAAGPLHNERGLLFAEIDIERVGSARRSLDVAGHYARPGSLHAACRSAAAAAGARRVTRHTESRSIVKNRSR